MSIVCGENYPSEPPSVKFNSCVNIPSVNQQNGQVDFSKNSDLRNWSSASGSMEYALVALKKEMIANKSLKQPADGTMY